MTSEERYGINEQPDATCGMIDAIKRDVVSAESLLDSCSDDSDQEFLAHQAWKSSMELYGVADRLEDLRDHVIKIRQWGQQWKDLAKAYAPTVDEDPA